MKSRTSFTDSLEDLNAMILAADPRDAETVAHLAGEMEELVAGTDPAAPMAELLKLALWGLQSMDGPEGARVLNAVASAVAASSQCSDVEEEGQASAAIETAALGLQEFLQRQPNEPSSHVVRAPVAEDHVGAKEVTGKNDILGSYTAAFDSDPEILLEFVAESRDRIGQAEAAILALEANPDDVESINSVLRAFHTIKGASGMLGLTPLQTLSHHAESLLIRARDGEIRMSGRNINLALQSCDSLKFMIDGLDPTGPDHCPAIPGNLDELLAALSGLRAPKGDSPVFADHDCAAAPAKIGTVPAEPARCPRVPTTFTKAAPQDSELIDGTSRGQSVGNGVMASANAPAAEEATQSLQQPPRHSKLSSEASIRVNTERLDHLVNLVGELVIAQSVVAQGSTVVDGDGNRLAQSVAHAGKIVRQLQDLAMSLRMVPLKGTFLKMTRLVRDLAHKSGKVIVFHTTGEDTEIDRNMVEILDDPLVHLIRNAVDHGIEPAASRISGGKNHEGSLHLRAYHAAGNVVIELEDDGKGLDRAKILEKAAERGLVEAGHNLSDSEIDFLIFHPGLSTADKVTEVSGRGVGLDVVKRNIESLRGRIEVTARPGKGTKFTLRLPLTMAIIDAMLLRVGKQKYLLPTIAIHRSFRPEAGAIATVMGRGEMAMLQDQLYPLVRLHRLFNIEEACTAPEQAMVIVIEGSGKRCALMVDELLGQQQAVIKSLGSVLSNAPGVAGGAILGDGRVGFILDAVGLVQLALGKDKTTPRTAAQEQRATEHET